MQIRNVYLNLERPSLDEKDYKENIEHYKKEPYAGSCPDDRFELANKDEDHCEMDCGDCVRIDSSKWVQYE